jgi:hypothetical protein
MTLVTPYVCPRLLTFEKLINFHETSPRYRKIRAHATFVHSGFTLLTNLTWGMCEWTSPPGIYTTLLTVSSFEKTEHQNIVLGLYLFHI